MVMRNKLAIVGSILIIACIAVQGCRNNGSQEPYRNEIERIHNELRQKYLDLFYLSPEEAKERIEENNKREQDEEEWKGLYKEYASQYREMETAFLSAVDELMELNFPNEYQKYNEAYIEYIKLWAEQESLQAQMYYLCIEYELRRNELRASNNAEYAELERAAYEVVDEIEELLEGDLQEFFNEFGLEQW